MHVFIIGYVWPEPNSSAAGHRMMQLIECLQQHNFQITFATPAQETEHQVNLSEYGIQAQPIILNCDSFNTTIQKASPNIVIFDRFMMEEQFGWRVEKCCPDALRILNTEDLHSLRKARQISVNTNQPFTPNAMHTDTGAREVAAILRSDLTLMISSYECQLLKTHFSVPEYQLMHLPFMLGQIDKNITTSLPSFQQRQHFISIGNFRHAPNWDMVLQLKQHIWPLIRQQLPEAELHIYGAYPPPKAMQLHNEKQGFLIKGWADDSLDVMQKARICLAPLRFGAGIKGKLIEAMQAGTSSITTSIGAEAMHEELPWNGSIIDEASAQWHKEFALAATRLYQDEEQWLINQQNAEHILAQHYDKAYWHKQLIQRLTEAKQQQENYRNINFLGMMVRHHSLKSSQYMSQWISAKNALKTDK